MRFWDVSKATLEVALDDKHPTEQFPNNELGYGVVETAAGNECRAVADGGDWPLSTVAGVPSVLGRL
ncbi:hypothetical protein AXE65_07765 [Ventosimonas gracilis]|uniref:Uncharacterized protein n=1 Tax=Ventosimonas gracilis TaxID=1680762 RepID=A0A139SHS6_9GAMM|nr:hypothetical protein [Ventosimonas gracilis]KXU34099.1 hypothetical protein AXE65_07765 [Ventosimonas gracilis]